MANTIQLRRGTSDVALSGGSATVANTGEPVVFLPDSGDQKFYIAKSGTAGDFVWMGAPISDTTSESSATKLMTANAIQAAITAGVQGEDTLAEMGDTDISSAASGHILVHDGSDSFDNVAVSGDVALAANGAVTIQSDAVEHSMLNDNCISGFTNIGAAPDNSDELLISDGGTLKAMTVANLASNSSFASGTPTDITVADESSDTTCFPLFVTAATGDLAPKSGTNLTFNSSSGLLTAGSFAGNITGDVTGDVTGNADTATKLAATKTINGTAFDGSDNITLGNDSVTAAMINDDLISGSAAALTSGLASTDELLISDAGTLKNMDVSVLQSYLQSNLTFTTNTDTDVSVDNLKTRLAGGFGSNAVTIGDSTDVVTIGNDLIVTGDLTVSGDTTTLNVATLDVEDKNITLNKGSGDTSGSADGAGITIQDAENASTDATLLWTASSDTFTFSHAINATLATAAQTNVTSVGALDGGSITSGFGNINNGSSTITTTGLISGGSLDIDNVLINGTTIGHTDDTDLMTVADGLLTVAGEISVTTLDIGGTNVTSTAAELNILDGVTSTATELNIMDGNTSATSTTVADADRVVFNDNGTMKQVAVTDLAAYFDDEITAMPNLVTSGALNSGSITSGFGNINNGSSTITTTGLISGGSLDIDDVLINGTTIGHTDDTDLITLADGLVTVAGEISVTTLDIGGTNVAATAAEINIIDGDTSATSTTLASADRMVMNDAGTMKQVALSDLVTYLEDGSTSGLNIDGGAI